MRRPRLLGSAATALLLLGCGGSSGSAGVAVAPAPTTSAPAPAPAPSPAPAATPTSTGLGACVNMGNHLEAPSEGEWGRPIADDDFQIIAAAGFKSIRLPVRWSAHAATTAPYAIEPAFMARVERLVGLARASGLKVILNIHHYDDATADPVAARTRFVELWRQIAARFRTADADVWFELLNEPHDKLNNANLMALLEPARLAIRETNPTRTLVWGGENWSGINSLATLPLPDDPNVVATFHFYDPFNFTHQGATWVNPSPPLGRRYPTGNDLADLQSAVQKAQAFQTRTGRRVFMGEYGAHSTVALAERAAYYKSVRDAFTAAGVDGCVWGYTNTFPFRTQTSWHQELLRAIGL